MVNNVVDCAGATKPFVPIGAANPFRGTFYGNGYKIKNLKIESDKNYVGLFGSASDSGIYNVVLDSSCSIKSTFNDNDPAQVYVGGVVGFPTFTTVKGCVNFADVTFSGNLTNSQSQLMIGGIAGHVRTNYTKSQQVATPPNIGVSLWLITF